MGFLGTIARHFDAFAGPAVMLLYPLIMKELINRYASARAIESPTRIDDQQWLTYWALYSLITLFELSCWKILAWFPFWPYIKLVFCLWLVLPIFNGAAFLYNNYVREFIKKIGGQVSEDNPEGQKNVLQMMSLESRKSVEHYIERYGSGAFQKVLKAAEQEAKKH